MKNINKKHIINKRFVINTIVDYFNVTLFDVKGESQNQEYVLVRKYLAHFLFEYSKLSVNEITKIVNKSRSSVSLYLSRSDIIKIIKGKQIYDKHYHELYTKIVNSKEVFKPVFYTLYYKNDEMYRSLNEHAFLGVVTSIPKEYKDRWSIFITDENDKSIDKLSLDDYF